MVKKNNNKKKVEFKTKKGKKVSFLVSGSKSNRSVKKQKISKIIKKDKIQVKIKDFGISGKGRKGKYFYVVEKGKKPKYYKVKEGIGEKEVKEFYKRGIVSKRGGVTKERVNKERKLDKIAKKYPKIEDVLHKGYAEYTVDNVKSLTPAGIRGSYMKLLLNKGVKDGALVKDKELLDIITRSENIEKWKHRVLFEVMVKNEKGEVMVTINNTQVKHLGELKKEVLDELKIGEEHDFRGFGTNEATTYTNSEVIKKIENSGYKINRGTATKGKIKDIKVKMTFRKSG